MSVADELDELAKEFSPSAQVREFMDVYAELPAPWFGSNARVPGGPSMPPTALEMLAASGGFQTLDGASLLDETVTGDKIAVGEIEAGHIASGSIDTVHFAASATIALVTNDGATVVIDSTGLAIYDGRIALVDNYGSVVMTGGGFAGSWLDFLAYNNMYNATWRAAPPTPASNITVGEASANQVPSWVWGITSGTSITARWMADATSPSGAKMRLSIASGGAAADQAEFTQVIPIIGTKARHWTYLPRVTFECPTVEMGTAGLAVVYIGTQYLKADGVTTTGPYSISARNLSGINSGANNLADVQIVANSGKGAPADAAYLRIKIGMYRSTAANTAAGSVYVYDIFPQRGEEQVVLTDNADPETYGYGTLYQGAGILRMAPAQGTHSNVSTFWLAPTAAGFSALAPSGTLTIEATSSVSLDANSIDLNATYLNLNGGNSINLGATNLNLAGGNSINLDATTTLDLYGATIQIVGTNITLDGKLKYELLATSFSARQDNFNPETNGGRPIWVIDNTSAGSRAITGISIGQTNGTIRHLHNVSGAQNITLEHEDLNSSATNRFWLGTTAYTITPNEGVTIFYYGGRWRVLDK